MARAYGKGFMRGLLHASTRASPDETSGNNDICNDPDGEFAAGPGLGSVHRAGLDRRRAVARDATGTAISCTAGCGYPLREEGEGLGLRLSLV
jgi:hypothetical protein